MKTMLAGLIVLAGLLTCRAETYYVATNGLDTRTGLGDWTNAVATITNAAKKATKIAASEILVSNGTYYVTNGLDYYYNNGVVLSNDVTCRGFSGNPQDVIVDGTATTRCFYITNAVLSAVTVTNCKPTYVWNNLYGDGGGVYVQPGRGVVSNCIITGNTGRFGGGVLSAGTVVDCRIVRNSGSVNAGFGGGACITAGQFLRNVVQGNFNTGVGGAMYLSGSPTIADCTIAQNTTTNVYGGGIRDASTATILNCLIISNVCATDGGTYGYGGGTYVSGSSIYSNCVFAYNNNTNGYGGGVYNISGGGIFYNCLISSNLAFLGAGVHIDNSVSSRWFNCTIGRNRSTRTGGDPNAGGLDIGNSATIKPLLVNCIIYDNMNTYSTGSNYIIGASSLPVFSNCCSMPSGLNTYGTGNIATNPVFKADDYNCRLARESPCLNAGLNQEWMIGAVDLDGRPRIDRFKRQVDMGAYEYVFPGTMFTVY